MHHAEHGVGNRLQARRRRRSAGIVGALIVNLAIRLMSWRERARQRRTLAALDDRMLKDIGLTRAHVPAESDRPFWWV